jgi:hypothetical protein
MGQISLSPSFKNCSVKPPLLGRAPKRYLRQSQNQSEILSIYPSVCLFCFLSLCLCLSVPLSLYIISIYRLLIYRLLFYHNLWDVVQVLPETSITIILGRCCIGSLSDAFPLGLGKNINGIRRSLTTPNLSQTLPLYKIMIRGPTNQNHAQKYHILVGLQMVYK